MTTFLPPLETDYLKVVSDNGNTTLDFKLHIEHEQRSCSITGTELQKRIGDRGLSASVLDYLLANQKLIPHEWLGKKVLFLGTVYRRNDSRLFVRYLYWYQAGWGWCETWLGLELCGSSPALLTASPSSLEERVSVLEAIVKNHNLTP